MRTLSNPNRLATHLRHSKRLVARSNRHRLYSIEVNATPPTPPPKKGLFRKIVLPTTLFGGIVYGAGLYGSFQNDKIHDFFVDQVPFGEALVNYCEESNLEQIGELSKRSIEIVERTVEAVKQTVGLEPRAESAGATETPVEQIKAKTAAAVQRAKESELAQRISGATAATAKQVEHTKSELAQEASGAATGIAKQAESIASSQPAPADDAPVTPIASKQSASDLQLYDRAIPIGHEPPPGYLGASPRPRDPSVGPAPPTPALPLLAPSVQKLSSSEPILGQLASSIDNLAGFLRDHPEVVVRGKDASGQDAPRVLSIAEAELKSLAARLEAIKQDEHAQLERQLEAQAKEYGKVLLDAERELHERLDQQEENWKDTFERERSHLAKSFEDKLAKELETQEELINERLRQEVISRGLEMQRKWMREIKSQVELEREGRWGKLAELEGCMKELGRVTMDNEEYLEDNLRVHQLWNAIRAMSTSAFDSPSKAPLDHEARALQRICARHAKLASTPSEGAGEAAPDVLSAALATIPAAAVESGVETLPHLTIWFRDSVAPRIQSASLFPAHGGLLSYLASYLLSNLFFTSSASAEPDAQDPISILSRVNGLLDAKNLDQATRELNMLKGWPKVLARDWIEAARRHLELQQAIQVIEAEARLQSLML